MRPPNSQVNKLLERKLVRCQKFINVRHSYTVAKDVDFTVKYSMFFSASTVVNEVLFCILSKSPLAWPHCRHNAVKIYNASLF